VKLSYHIVRLSDQTHARANGRRYIWFVRRGHLQDW